MRKRMSSFITRGQALITQGKTEEAAKIVIRGLQHYTDTVIKALQPYAKADASLIVIVLRHLADEVEKRNDCKQSVEDFSKLIVFPELEEIEKVQKINSR